MWALILVIVVKKISIATYADAPALVVAERNAMRPETTKETNDHRVIDTEHQMSVTEEYNKITTAGITDHDDAFKKLYHQSEDKKSTSFYRSAMIVSNKFLVREKDKGIDIDYLFDDETSYKVTIKQLLGGVSS